MLSWILVLVRDYPVLTLKMEHTYFAKAFRSSFISFFIFFFCGHVLIQNTRIAQQYIASPLYGSDVQCIFCSVLFSAHRQLSENQDCMRKGHSYSNTFYAEGPTFNPYHVQAEHWNIPSWNPLLVSVDSAGLNGAYTRKVYVHNLLGCNVISVNLQDLIRSTEAVRKETVWQMAYTMWCAN